MNAFFINPFSQNITTVDYDGDYKSISRMIDASRGCFDVVRLYRNQDAAFVDDEDEAAAIAHQRLQLLRIRRRRRHRCR